MGTLIKQIIHKVGMWTIALHVLTNIRLNLTRYVVDERWKMNKATVKITPSFHPEPVVTANWTPESVSVYDLVMMENLHCWIFDVCPALHAR